MIFNNKIFQIKIILDKLPNLKIFVVQTPPPNGKYYEGVKISFTVL